MKLPGPLAVTILLAGAAMADTDGIDDSLAYLDANRSPLVMTVTSMPSHQLITPLAIPEPLPEAVTPAAAAIMHTHPAGNSLLEAVTAMIGIIGMLILVFRRRTDSV